MQLGLALVQHPAPLGQDRIRAPVQFGRRHIAPLVSKFLDAHAGVEVELLLNDRNVDLIEEGFDLGIRITKLDDSGMIARKLSDFRVYACATPAFIAENGPLTHPSELSRIPFLIDTNSRSHNSLRFLDTDGDMISVSVTGPIEVNSPLATLRAARAGMGIAMIPDFIARPYLASGELVSLFDDFIAKDRGIYAVYPHRRYLPAKVRAFVDYLHAWFKRYS